MKGSLVNFKSQKSLKYFILTPIGVAFVAALSLVEAIRCVTINTGILA